MVELKNHDFRKDSSGKRAADSTYIRLRIMRF